MGTPMPVRGAKPSKHTSNTRLSNFNITRRIKFHRNKKQKKCDLLCLFLGCYFAFTYDEAQRINCINCSKTRNMQYFSFRIKALSLFEAITSDVSRQTVLFPFFFFLAIIFKRSWHIISDGPVGFLTHADGCDDRSGDDWQGHAPRDGQIPSVTRRLLQLVVGVDLWERRGTHAV